MFEPKCFDNSKKIFQEVTRTLQKTSCYFTQVKGYQMNSFLYEWTYRRVVNIRVFLSTKKKRKKNKRFLQKANYLF